MTFWKWSKTAASNASADSTINWAEGMAPSAVNDSARAMMAAAAKYRDDVAGAVFTGGTATAYTLATNQAFDTLANMSGATVAFIAHATNTGACTLNVDGLGAKPLRSASGADIGAGVLIFNTVYQATYFNSTGEWILHGFYGATDWSVPLGAMLDYTGVSAPNSRFVLPFGQAISRTTYAQYFAVVGITYGAGDGATTFNVPDLRGRFVAGKDDMGGAAASRLTLAAGGVEGNALNGTGGAQTRTIALANLPNVSLTTTITDPGHAHALPNVNASATTSGGAGAFLQANLATPQGAVNFFGNGGNVNTSTTGITASTSLGGSGTALNIVPPTIVLNKILRVL